MKSIHLFLPFLIAIAGCATQNPPAKIDTERQAKIEKALKDLKDEDAYVRVSAVRALRELKAKEYVKDIARFLKDNAANVRCSAIDALGQLGAKEYADEIGKLINDLSWCSVWDEAKKNLKPSTVSAEAERVLKEWGYDVEKLKEQNKK